MNATNRNTSLNRQRGAIVLPVAFRFEGPVAQELRAGLCRAAAEIRRMAERVRIHRALRRMDLDEIRAVREVDWLREELVHQERNLSWIEFQNRQQREKLTDRLQQLAGGPQ